MRISVSVFLTFAAAAAMTAAFGDGRSSGKSPSARAGKTVAAKLPDKKEPVPIVLYPAVEPRPSLKYQLLPPYLDRRPGNAAAAWNRLQTELDRPFPLVQYEEIIVDWSEMPLGTREELEYRNAKLVPYKRLIEPSLLFSNMDWAARLESCDWEWPMREGGILNVQLSDIQRTRSYARLLAAKAHLEIAQGRYDRAVGTFQTGYALARHVAQGPLFVVSLVGITNAMTISDQVRQFIQQPDAPSLYWALAALPHPLIDFRPALDVESHLLYLHSPELRGLDKKRLSPEGWQELLVTVAKEMALAQTPWNWPNPDDPRYSRAIILAHVARYEPFARRYLIEHGLATTEVRAMPAAQAVLLAAMQIYDDVNQNWSKWYPLPYPEATAGWDREKLKQESIEGHETLLLAERILQVGQFSMLRWVKNSDAHSQLHFAMLQVFEAMRLYAGTHDGRWPDQLSEITEIQVPNDPFTEKPFVYQRHGDKVIVGHVWKPGEWIGGSPPPGPYEVTLMPKQK